MDDAHPCKLDSIGNIGTSGFAAMESGREKLRRLVTAFVEAASDLPQWQNYGVNQALAEFQALYEQAESEGLVAKIGIQKSDDTGKPVPPGAGDLWKFYLLPLLSRCKSLGKVRDNFEKLYPTFEESIYADHATWQVIAPLAKLVTEGPPIDFPNGVTIRRLEEDEKKQFLTQMSYVEAIEQGIVNAEYCLSHRSDGPKAGPIEGGRGLSHFQQVVTALRLLKPGGIWFNATSQSLEYPAFGTQFPVGQQAGGGWSSKPRAYGPEYRLNRDESPLAGQIVTALPLAKQNRILSRALDRFGFAYERNRAEDRLVDFWIALEALFLKPEEQTELSFRAALRIARFVGESPDDRLATFQGMKESYAARSRVVHGNPLPSAIGDIANTTEQTLRKALRRGVLNTTPPNLASLDADAVLAERADPDRLR